MPILQTEFSKTQWTLSSFIGTYRVGWWGDNEASEMFRDHQRYVSADSACATDGNNESHKQDSQDRALDSQDPHLDVARGTLYPSAFLEISIKIGSSVIAASVTISSLAALAVMGFCIYSVLKILG